MGNCCSGSNNDVDVNMMQGTAKGGAPAQYFSQPLEKLIEQVLDERDVLGYRGEKKIVLIVKLQALMRGAFIRRNIKQKHGFQAKTFASHNVHGPFGTEHYDNRRVQEIKETLGDFQYPYE